MATGTPSRLGILRACYEAVNQGDFEPSHRAAAEDNELHSLFLPGRVLRGPTAVDELYREIGEVIEDYRQELEELHEVGDQVVAIVTLTGVGKESRAPVVQRYATVWTFRGDKIVKGISYTEPDEAFASVGLDRPS
jgi:ketosteroid isomerase-like protein